MWNRQIAALVALSVLCAAGSSAFGQAPKLSINSSNDNNPAPSSLPGLIVDSASDYTYAGFVTTNANTPDGPLASSLRAMGSFANGMVASGTDLPDANQPNPNNPTATYAGGIGIASGICLCTGIVTDADTQGLPTIGVGQGVGVEGPNNGDLETNEGEIGVVVLGPLDPENLQREWFDEDFNEHVHNGELTTNPELTSSGDPTVLVFQITLQKPGFLRLRWVFGSDEYPFYIDQEFNDSFAILIKKDACTGAEFENIALFKDPNETLPKPFSLQSVRACGPPLFKENQLAPAPSLFVNPVSPHAIDSTPGQAPHQYDVSIPYFDHEFAAFTKPLISETPKALSVGTYTIKIVIHDVGDARVDAALFIEDDSLKLFALNPGDFNGNGNVGWPDYFIWDDNFGMTGATFSDGDADGDCDVDGDDYDVWVSHFGQSGNADLSADFNRDGCVDTADWVIWRDHLGLATCASRFEGDADGDGDVDGGSNPASGDYAIWAAQYGNCSSMLMSGGEELTASSEGESLASIKDRLPTSADMDGDGDVDQDDLPLLRQALVDASGGSNELTAAAPAEDAPTAAPTQVLPAPQSQPLIPNETPSTTPPVPPVPIPQQGPAGPVEDQPPGPFGPPLPIPPGGPRDVRPR